MRDGSGYIDCHVRVLHVNTAVDAEVSSTAQAHAVRGNVLVAQDSTTVGSNPLQFLHALVQFRNGSSAVHEFTYFIIQKMRCTTHPRIRKSRSQVDREDAHRFARTRWHFDQCMSLMLVCFK